MVFRMILRLGISRSDLVREMAHCGHSTGARIFYLMMRDCPVIFCYMAALHWAAAKGNILLVRWLLHNGAYESIHVKNRMGCTPLDMARIFGPHLEVIQWGLFAIVLLPHNSHSGTTGRRRARGCFA